MRVQQWFINFYILSYWFIFHSPFIQSEEKVYRHLSVMLSHLYFFTLKDLLHTYFTFNMLNFIKYTFSYYPKPLKVLEECFTECINWFRDPMIVTTTLNRTKYILVDAESFYDKYSMVLPAHTRLYQYSYWIIWITSYVNYKDIYREFRQLFCINYHF